MLSNSCSQVINTHRVSYFPSRHSSILGQRPFSIFKTREKLSVSSSGTFFYFSCPNIFSKTFFFYFKFLLKAFCYFVRI
uniref:Uncharacterized protein n=1 Tax=Rhizophora mucronata TaxID=61149 RepID=A0A2P2JPX5_RHIMU